MLEISLFCVILREIRVQWQKGVGLQKNSEGDPKVKMGCPL